MSLITVFGEDPDEVAEQVEDLEQRLKHAQNEKEKYEKRARKKRRWLQKHRRRAIHKHEAIESVEERLPKVNALQGRVETVGCPRIAYKSVDVGIATLLIPEGATIVHPQFTSEPHKRRTDEVDVLRIDGRIQNQTTIGGSPVASSSLASTGKDPMRGSSDTATAAIDYEVGETFTPSDARSDNRYITTETKLNEDVEQECAGGIHFFRERSEAVEWYRFQN